MSTSNDKITRTGITATSQDQTQSSLSYPPQRDDKRGRRGIFAVESTPQQHRPGRPAWQTQAGLIPTVSEGSTMTVFRAALLAISFTPLGASAHHAIGGNYVANSVIEVEGEVTEILWRNPHVQVAMRVVGNDGSAQSWAMATTSLSNMRRWQMDRDFIAVGDRIRVAGNPARDGGLGLYIRNILTTRGEEVLLGPNIEPRWSEQLVEMSASRRSGRGDTSAPELGIFRVWSHPDTIPMLIPRNWGRMPENREKITELARNAVDQFVWERDNPLGNCSPKGMPTIMEAPYPFEFRRDGDDILWHNEEFDTVRRIHMDADATAEGQPESLLGYSVGHWENDRTLVVETTKMGWGHFDGLGVPITGEAVMIERFTLTPQGDRLDYSTTITDPAVFTEPVTLSKHWVWFPDAEVGAYACLRAAED
jgi:hypothetical protein